MVAKIELYKHFVGFFFFAFVGVESYACMYDGQMLYTDTHTRVLYNQSDRR